MSQAQDVGEEENPPSSPSTNLLDLHDTCDAIAELHEDLGHERDRRYALTDLVRKAPQK